MFLQKLTHHPDKKILWELQKVKTSWENSCSKTWNPWGCWHLKPQRPSALQGVIFPSREFQKQFSSLFQPEEGREKQDFTAATHFSGVDQLLPRNSLRATQSFSLHVQGLGVCSCTIHRHRPHCLVLSSWQSTHSFVVLLPLKGFLCWPQRNDFASSGFISTPLALIFFGCRISPALILQGFSYHALLAWTLSPLQIVSLQKEKKNEKSARHWFDIVNFVVFNGFSARGGCWRLFVSWFSYITVEFKCCWSNVFNQREAFYFQGCRCSILSSLNHTHKGF